jgi:hypothetical protein
MGYYTPWALAGGIVTAIGNGLVSTFTPSTNISVWVGYQIVLGAGRGCGMQMVRNGSARSATPLLTFPGNHRCTKRRIARTIPNRPRQSRFLPKPQHFYCYCSCEHNLRADPHLRYHTLRAYSIACRGA